MENEKIKYMIQGHGNNGDWDEDYVGNDPDANTFDTEAEATAMISCLVQTFSDDDNPPTIDDFRVVERK